MRHLVGHAPQELNRYHPFGARVQFGKRHLARAVDDHEEVLLAFLGLHFCKIDGQAADGIVFGFPLGRALPVFAQAQAADAVALETPVQGRAQEVRNRRLQRIGAII